MIFKLTEEERNAHPALRPPEIQDPHMHPLKKNNHRRFLRVSSIEKMPSDETYFNGFKPLTEADVARMREEDLQVKLCDMGNACYIDKHYSDII